jgi:signal transduction histidine kinase
MPFSTWFRPPRHLLALFLLVTFVPSALLFAAGWRLLQQDTAVREQQARERREQVADLAVSALHQHLDDAIRALARGEDLEGLAATGDAVAVVFAGETVRAVPAGRVLYFPVRASLPEAPAGVFAGGEAFEDRDGNHAAAAAWFGRRGSNPDPAIRAGALIGQARNLWRAGDVDRALETSREVPGDVAFNGVPADLLAGFLRGVILEDAGRLDALQAEAAALYGDLMAGRWTLDRILFEANVEEVLPWLGNGPAPATSEAAQMLTEAVERLWDRWRTTPADESESGTDVVTVAADRLVVVWHRTAAGRIALVAGPSFVERQWLEVLHSAFERQEVAVSLSAPGTQPHALRAASRAASETGLPWTVTVTDLADEGSAGRSRSFWLAGLVLLLVATLGGTVVVARAVGRELAVARLQSDFVAAVSHEFRTPLTSLRQITEVLADGRVPSESRRQTYYEALVRQTQRLSQLVEALLDFGRMEAGTSPYRLELLDALAWVQSVIDQFNRENAARGHQVELRAELPAARVSADPPALTNALWNLLDNAVKYSPDRDRVWVDVRREQDRLAVRVRDEGLGIPDAERQEIFRKFIRGAEARARSIPGTGIGLAMVDHIVKAHGGEVRVESAPGTGSTFTLLLPCLES